jgi:hypothetical protein
MKKKKPLHFTVASSNKLNWEPYIPLHYYSFKGHMTLEHSEHKRRPLDLQLVQGIKFSVLASAPSDS